MLSDMRSEDCLQDVFEKVRVKLHLHTNNVNIHLLIDCQLGEFILEYQDFGWSLSKERHPIHALDGHACANPNGEIWRN